MGLSNCKPKARSVELGEEFDDTIAPGTVKFYRFDLGEAFVKEKKDVKIVVTAESGLFEGVFVSLDEKLPKSGCKRWKQEHLCACTNPLCDHNFPRCRDNRGAICVQCLLTDEELKRVQHDAALAHLATNWDEQEKHHFGLRLQTVDPLFRPGFHYLTVKARPGKKKEDAAQPQAGGEQKQEEEAKAKVQSVWKFHISLQACEQCLALDSEEQRKAVEEMKEGEEKEEEEPVLVGEEADEKDEKDERAHSESV